VKLIALSEVDSTSTRAAELLRAGESAPFAVWAARQTAGRGRRGNDWESPAGNLHLTLALRGGAVGPDWGCLPLKAGVIVARTVERALGVRLTLKWPNDLLFGGRKVGGLLLEGSLQGQVGGEVLVGVGLNLAVAPKLAGPYTATSLLEITGRRFEAGDFAKLLADAFAAEWDATPLAEVPRAFQAYAIGPGHVWEARGQSGAPVFVTTEGPDGAGELTVTPLGGGSPERLSSVDHGYVWVHQLHQSGDEPRPLVVADVGNSFTKLARFPGAEAASPDVRATVANDEGDAAWRDAALLVLGTAPRRPWPVHFASVNPAAARRLEGAVRVAGGTAVPLEKRPVLRHGKGYALDELGIDRLAAIEGWLARLGADERIGDAAGVIVGAGTAMTVDLVRASGEHLGGFIAPGLATALRSLHDAAALLPRLEARSFLDVAEGPASTTEAAMRGGAVQMLAGLVERSARWLAADAPGGGVRGSVAVVLTGGGGEALRSALRSSLRPSLAPDLVLEGLRAMALGGARPAV
jgi:BirA family biotin operon repressor/biotin-[acetyl-CoA-carboxylase] ligase